MARWTVPGRSEGYSGGHQRREGRLRNIAVLAVDMSSTI